MSDSPSEHEEAARIAAALDDEVWQARVSEQGKSEAKQCPAYYVACLRKFLDLSGDFKELRSDVTGMKAAMEGGFASIQADLDRLFKNGRLSQIDQAVTEAMAASRSAHHRCDGLERRIERGSGVTQALGEKTAEQRGRMMIIGTLTFAILNLVFMVVIALKLLGSA